VLLIERDTVPREHVGESLMPEAYWILERLGIAHEMDRVGFTRKHGVQFVSSSGKESKPFIFADHDDRACNESWHVKRDQFDKLIYDTAYNRGATCIDQTRVVDIDIRQKGPHKVEIQTPEGKTQEIMGKVIIDASGQSAMIANRMKIKEVYPDLKKAAIWGYFDGAERAGGGNPEVTCILQTESKDAWFWYIPLYDGTVSVGLVADNDFLLKRGTSPQETSYRTTTKSGDGWVLVGDAGGFIDPIYSSGVFLALKSGLMAGEAVAAGLSKNDISAKQLGKWEREFESGVTWIRKLVQAYYTKEFSIGDFIKAHPEHIGNLTDLLIGRVYGGSRKRKPANSKLQSSDPFRARRSGSS